jgi:HEAT repeat protein
MRVFVFLLLFWSLYSAQENLESLIQQLGATETAAKAHEQLLTYPATPLLPYLQKEQHVSVLLGLMKVLGDLGEVQVAPSFKPFLESPHLELRTGAVDALSNFDKAGALVLQGALKDSDAFLAGKAAYYVLKYPEGNQAEAQKALERALMEVKSSSALLQLLEYVTLLKIQEDFVLGKALLTSLRQENPEVRESAWKVFQGMFPKNPHPFQAQSPEKSERNKQIIEILKWLNSQNLTSRIQELAGPQAEQVYQELLKEGAGAVSGLISVLNHENVKVRTQALALLTVLDTKQEGLVAVLALGNDPEEQVRLGALTYLEKSALDSAFAFVEKALEDSRGSVREKALRLLLLKDTAKKALSKVVKTLSDPEALVRLAALDYLAQAGDPTTVPFIVTTAETDSAYQVKIGALKALYSLKATEPAKRPLLALLGSKDKTLAELQQYGFWEVLLQLAVQAPSASLEEAFPLLLEQLPHLSASGLEPTLKALLSFSSPLTLAQSQEFCAFLNHSTPSVRQQAGQVYLAKKNTLKSALNPQADDATRQAQLAQLQKEIHIRQNWPVLQEKLQATLVAPEEEDQLAQAGTAIHDLLLPALPSASENLAVSLLNILKKHPNEAVFQGIQALSQKTEVSEPLGLALIACLKGYSTALAQQRLIAFLASPHSTVRNEAISALISQSSSNAENSVVDSLKKLAESAKGMDRLRLEMAIFSLSDATLSHQNRFFEESFKVFQNEKASPEIQTAYKFFLDFVSQADSVTLYNKLLSPEILAKTTENALKISVLESFTKDHKKYQEQLNWGNVIPLLEAPEEESALRSAAIQCLKNLTGETFSYKASAGLQERQEAITSFQTLWKTQQNRSQLDSYLGTLQEQVQKEQWTSLQKELVDKKDKAEHLNLFLQVVSFLSSSHLSNSAKAGLIEHILSNRSYESYEVGSALVDALVALLSSEDAPLRYVSIVGLRNLSTQQNQASLKQKLLSQLREQLKHHDYKVRFYAVMTLSWTEDKNEIALLLPALQDQEASIRMEAAYALLSLEGLVALHHLKPLLEDSSDKVRQLAVRLSSELAQEKHPYSLQKSFKALNTLLEKLPLTPDELQTRGESFYRELSSLLNACYHELSLDEQHLFFTTLQKSFGEEAVAFPKNQLQLKLQLLSKTPAVLQQELSSLQKYFEKPYQLAVFAAALSDTALSVREEALGAVLLHKEKATDGLATLKKSESLLQALYLSLKGDSADFLKKTLALLRELKGETETLPTGEYDENKMSPVERQDFLKEWRQYRLENLLARLHPKALKEAQEAKDTAKVQGILKEQEEATHFIQEFDETTLKSLLLKKLEAEDQKLEEEYASTLIRLFGKFTEKESIDKLLELSKKAQAGQVERLGACMDAVVEMADAFLKAPENLQTLTEMLNSTEDEKTQVHLAYALTAIGVPQQNLLSKNLRSTKTEVRQATLTRLAQLHSARFAKEVASAFMEEKEESLQREMLEVLKKTATEHELGYLILGANSHSEAIKTATVPVLKKLALSDRGDTFQAWLDWWQKEEQARLKALLRDLGHADPDLVRRNRNEIANQGTLVLPLVQETLKDPKKALEGGDVALPGQVRQQCVLLIGQLLKDKSPEVLLPYLQDPDSALQREVIEQLGQYGNPNTISALKTVPEGSANYLYACQALYQLGDDIGLPKILATLASENPTQRQMGYGILTRLKVQVAKVREQVAKEADLSALLFGLDCLNDTQEKENTGTFVEYLKHSDLRVRKKAIEGLENLYQKQNLGYDYKLDPKESVEAYQRWETFHKSQSAPKNPSDPK